MSRPDSFGAALAIALLAAIVASAIACGANGQPAPDASPPPTPAPSPKPALPSSGSDEPAQSDPINLARRLNGYTGACEIEQRSPALGDIEEFDVIVLPVNPDQRPTFRTVSASLRAVSEHAYFYVEPLAQRFELRLVTFGSPPLVREIAVDSSNRAVVPLAGLGGGFQTAILVVVGATEGTTEVAPYRYEITQGG